ncbi:MAG: lysylphosphatidylglycerol synthase transmembrane domain-containing protein [Ferruginibacter sp.]
MKKLLSYLKYVIFLGGGLFLVWWQLHEMTPEQKILFNDALMQADYLLIIGDHHEPAESSQPCHALKLLMEPLGYFPKLKNVFAVTMIGYLANGAVNRLGEVLKCTFLAKYEKLPADKLIGTILIERAFDLICYILFITLTVIIQLDVLGDFAMEKLRGIAHGGAIPFWAKGLIFISVIVLTVLTLKFIFARYPQNRALLKIKNFIKGIGKGFAAIKTLKHRKLFIVHTLFIWSMYLLQIYLAFKAMEATAHLGIREACTVLSLSTLAMILTPGGIGSFPIFVMKTLLIYGIASSAGNALGWLIWGVSTGIIIVSGVVSLLILPYINKKRHEVSTGYPG